MVFSVFSPRFRRLRGFIFFAVGVAIYLLGISALFGRVLWVLPVMLGLYVALFAAVMIYERMGWTGIVVDEGLTMLSRKLAELFDAQMEAEKKAREDLEALINEVDYLPLKLLMIKVKLDTEKHEALLGTIKRSLSREVEVPSRSAYQEQVVRVEDALKRHMEMEAEMIKWVEEEVAATRSRLLRAILGAVLEEEHAHHETFRRVLTGTPRAAPSN